MDPKNGKKGTLRFQYPKTWHGMYYIGCIRLFFIVFFLQISSIQFQYVSVLSMATLGT